MDHAAQSPAHDHDAPGALEGPIVSMTPELAARMASAVDAPARRGSRVTQVVLVVLGAVAATAGAVTGHGLLQGLALVLLVLAALLLVAAVVRGRRTAEAIGAQDQVAVRYDSAARLVRFPLAGTEHPLDAFTGVRVTDEVLVLTRMDRTRTPIPVQAMPDDQREALVAALTR